jgi:ABC-2 type transport system ATP-binding protein
MDPDGIRWLRRLLQDFAAGGGTALLSSHLLGEVQATVDHLVVIRAGRIVADDDLHALLASRGTIVRALDPVALANALDRAGVASTLHPDGTLHAAADAEAVGRIAAGAGAVVVELRDRAELEDLFFQLTA